MSRGYRLSIIVFGLTLLAFQVHSQEAEKPTLGRQPTAEDGSSVINADHDGAPENYTELIEQIASELVGIKGVISDLEKKVNAPESADRTQRENRNLQAQEDMALWAMWMFIATILTVVVAAIGILYVRRTLLETRRLGQAQVRAYVVAKGGTFNVTEKCIEYLINFRNVGQSPATNCKIRCFVGISPPRGRTTFHTSGPAKIVAIASGAEERAYFLFNVEGNPALSYDGPRKDPPFEQFFPNIPGEAVRTLREGGGWHYDLQCTVSWDDVFGRRQRQTFSFQERESELITGSEGTYRSGSFTEGTTQNYNDGVDSPTKETRYKRLFAKVKEFLK